jgi:PASTA domain-containing protein/hemolysin type calcium-binding protein
VSKSGIAVAVAAVFLALAAAAGATVTAEYFEGELTVESDAADAITIECVGGAVRVNRAGPEGGPAPCREVEVVEVGGGPGPNAVDLDAVTPTAFPALESVAAFGEDGDDTIAGSALDDELHGGSEDDTLRGNAGNDELNGGDGDDRLLGGAGEDKLFAAVGTDSLDGGAGSDLYSLDLFELGPGARVGDSGTEGTDTIELLDCEGVTVEAGHISDEGVQVAVSGIERYPCGYTPPPAPQPPPAPPSPTARTGACVVPQLRGRSLVRARRLIAKAGCKVGKITRVRSRARRGMVLKQRPVAGARRPRGTKVALRVSRGP